MSDDRTITNLNTPSPYFDLGFANAVKAADLVIGEQ